jgi:hypothetical protein
LLGEISCVDEDIKITLKRVAKNTEIRAARSVLRWKYRRSGKRLTDEEDLDRHSEVIADQAHQIIAETGRSIWNELKKAYHKGQKKEDSDE